MYHLLSSTNPKGCWKPHGRHPARDILPVAANILVVLDSILLVVNILLVVDNQTYNMPAN